MYIVKCTNVTKYVWWLESIYTTLFRPFSKYNMTFSWLQSSPWLLSSEWHLPCWQRALVECRTQQHRECHLWPPLPVTRQRVTVSQHCDEAVWWWYQHTMTGDNTSHHWDEHVLLDIQWQQCSWEYWSTANISWQWRRRPGTEREVGMARDRERQRERS